MKPNASTTPRRTVWVAEPTLGRGGIWLADLGQDPEDAEQAFVRPALIVSDDRLHHPRLSMVIVVPGTSTLRSLPMHVEVEPDGDNGLHTPTAFQTEQVRAVSTRRLRSVIGRLGVVEQGAIDEVLRTILRL